MIEYLNSKLSNCKLTNFHIHNRYIGLLDNLIFRFVILFEINSIYINTMQTSSKPVQKFLSKIVTNIHTYFRVYNISKK